MMMLEMALVTLISGVCNAGVTFQITMYPTKQANTKTVKCAMNDGGATAPSPKRARAPIPKVKSGAKTDGLDSTLRTGASGMGFVCV